MLIAKLEDDSGHIMVWIPPIVPRCQCKDMGQDAIVRIFAGLAALR